eukprot:3001331-Alexandrium_andersonii.AAC.1
MHLPSHNEQTPSPSCPRGLRRGAPSGERSPSTPAGSTPNRGCNSAGKRRRPGKAICTTGRAGERAA